MHVGLIVPTVPRLALVLSEQERKDRLAYWIRDARTYLRDFVDALPGYRLYRIVREGVVPVAYDERWEIFTTTNFLAVRESPARSPAE
jgi:hypothetical protein